MKLSFSTLLPITALCSFALTSHAAFLVNDTWADGDRTSTGPDGGGIDSAWYNGGTGATLTSSVGHLIGGVAATSSASWTTYLTPAGSPVTLSSAGDNLTLTWVFTPTGVDATTNTSQSFRLALVNTPAADRLTADGSPADTTFTGYGMFMNMATVLGRSTPFSLMERSLLTTGNLLSSSGNWASLVDDGGTGDTGYADGVQYTFTLSLTRTAANALDLLATMSGGSVGNDGTLQVSFTDTTPNTFSFDTFSLRPSRADQSASQFDITLFQADATIAPVPEPSTFALLGTGLVGLAFAGYRRFRS